MFTLHPLGSLAAFCPQHCGPHVLQDVFSCKIILVRRLCWFGHALCRQPNLQSYQPGSTVRLEETLWWTAENLDQDLELILDPCLYSLRRWNREWLTLMAALQWH